MLDTNISRTLNRHIDDVWVVPASTYDMDMVDLSEQQRRRLRIYENNLVGRLTGIKKVE